MAFLPEEEIRGNRNMNMAPMIDFLFLMVVFFASLAVSRIATRDTEVDLVKVEPSSEAVTTRPEDDLKIINLSVSEEGDYKWVTEIHDYQMATADEVGQELRLQYEKGLLPEDRKLTKILVKIDRKAEWEPILRLIFAVRDAGFEIRPVYDPEADEA